MSKYPRKDNERLFRDFGMRESRKFQTNWELLQELHPGLFDD
jgi:hypothetical protein